MEEIIAALGDNAWTLAGATILGIAGSTGASTLITQMSESRRSGKAFKREKRESAIKAAAEARATFLSYGDATTWSAIDPVRDAALMEAESAVHVAVASTGHKNTYELARTFIDTGVKYAAHHEETSREKLDDSFKALMQELVRKIPG